LVIAFALLPNGFPGRDDANDFILVFGANGVGHQQEHKASYHAEGLPPEFAAFDAILVDQGPWVGKDQHGILETHAMLARVAPGLGFIPLESDHGENSITPKM
jgi:hypothetical protein